MSTRFLDIFGLEHYHNLIMQKIKRRVYKQRIVVDSTVDQDDIIFVPNNNYTDDYTYETGDEELIDVFVNGLRLDMAEYYAWHATSQIHIRMGTDVSYGSVGETENIIEIVLRK